MNQQLLKKALFIINPHSGTRKKGRIPYLINKYLDHNKFEKRIVFTTYAGQGREIAKDERGNFDLIVAVGGDGTINEIAQPLINSTTTLGIIPMGSGNGLARHLGISLKTKKAITLINRWHTTTIDTINLNNDVFLNVAGVGFDAHIASLFADSKSRGLLSYASLAFQEILKFKSTGYKMIIDGKEKVENAPFLISIANSSQYGNNAHIAPNAKISDGLMDICVLQAVPFWYYPVLLFHLFNGSLNKSKYYRCWQGKEVQIQLLDTGGNKHIHMDGDPYLLDKHISLSTNPKSLSVICKKL